ncbi:MAG: ARPP-1 family domain-containing protein [Terriglobales bacterium]
MNPKVFALLPALVLSAGIALFWPCRAPAGEISPTSGYTVLAPIRHGNLTVFPVVAAQTYDTEEFLTLDEGLRSGEVLVTESGSVQPLMRRGRTWAPQAGAQVNQLVLVNNSKRPLILLAGEIVTGGKQDRVIGKDRIIPPESDPLDLGVFCVEPGRWTGSSDSFGLRGSTSDAVAAPMAAPNVRAKAMADKDQQQVWAEVAKTRTAMSETVAVAGAAQEINRTSSYARVMDNAEVKHRVDSVAEPIQRNYQSLMQQLRNQHAVGVVVAVNGQMVWADIFASTNLLEKYWPKLVRSYAAEAVVTRPRDGAADIKQAQEFLHHLDGRHETVDSEPGLYRQTEIAGDGFRAFELTSLLPKTGFDLHVAKMVE